MSREFYVADLKMAWLPIPSVPDWLPEGPLARFVAEIVGSLDLGRLTSAYGHYGKRAYHPRKFLAQVFHGYATGVFSICKLERLTRDSVAFHKRFVGELEELLFQILMMARLIVNLKQGTVRLHSTKIQANAYRRKVLSCEYAKNNCL